MKFNKYNWKSCVPVAQMVGDRDVSNFGMVTDLWCWRKNHYIGDFFRHDTKFWYIIYYIYILYIIYYILIYYIFHHQNCCNPNDLLNRFFLFSLELSLRVTMVLFSQFRLNGMSWQVYPIISVRKPLFWMVFNSNMISLNSILVSDGDSLSDCDPFG